MGAQRDADLEDEVSDKAGGMIKRLAKLRGFASAIKPSKSLAICKLSAVLEGVKQVR